MVRRSRIHQFEALEEIAKVAHIGPVLKIGAGQDKPGRSTTTDALEGHLLAQRPPSQQQAGLQWGGMKITGIL